MKGGAEQTGLRIGWLFSIFYIVILTGCRWLPASAVPVPLHPGELTEVHDRYGAFYVYYPATEPKSPEVLVLVHGTPAKSDTAEFTAHYYAAGWQDFAEAQGWLLIVPAFNQTDFSSRYGDHAMGGYRGLFGREIGADEWVLRLVHAYQAELGLPQAQFMLYGHSAGGQFTARFVVRHPQVLKQAVISSAATYPQPQAALAWPFGMGELHDHIEWDDGSRSRVDIVPSAEQWLAATQVPLTVIVGLGDTADIRPDLIPGQKGSNRYTIANNWVQDMAALAAAHGLESRITLQIIPGKGHSMSGLLPYTQGVLQGD